jgi:hypothetical protein
MEKNTTSANNFYPRGSLNGFRNGQKLPGSPILNINNAWINSSNDISVLRPLENRSFVFRLQESWTAAGDLTVEFEVNADRALPETGNNTASATASFYSVESPCLVVKPVWTTNGIYNLSDPVFPAIADRALSLLPFNDFKIYHDTSPLGKPVFKVEVVCHFVPFPPFVVCVPVPIIENEPFNMNGKEDRDIALFWLAFDHMLADDPDACEETHRLGAVPASVTSFNGVAGLDSEWPDFVPSPLPPLPIPPGGRSLLVRMRDQDLTTWNATGGGFTLAHELCHNYNREHVDQTMSALGCGGSQPAGAGAYPYDTCTFGPMDFSNPATFFGFDPITGVAVAPNQAGDLMSYASSRWTSDFTWQAVLDESPIAKSKSAQGSAKSFASMT